MTLNVLSIVYQMMLNVLQNAGRKKIPEANAETATMTFVPTVIFNTFVLQNFNHPSSL